MNPLGPNLTKKAPPSLVIRRYKAHKRSAQTELDLCERSNGSRKIPNFPSSISEEIMAMAFGGIRTPSGVSGDVLLPKKAERGRKIYYRTGDKVECKAITQFEGAVPGPTSFSPKTDPRAKLAIGIMNLDTDIFSVYEAGMVSDVHEIMMNSNETFGQQQMAGKRPRVVLVSFNDDGSPVWHESLSVVHKSSYLLQGRSIKQVHLG